MYGRFPLASSTWTPETDEPDWTAWLDWMAGPARTTHNVPTAIARPVPMSIHRLVLQTIVAPLLCGSRVVLRVELAVSLPFGAVDLMNLDISHFQIA